MKKYLIIFIVNLFFVSSVFAQGEIFDDISTAFRSADHRLLSKYFNGKVELTLLDQSNVFSKTQAEMVMKDFFGKYDPTSFEILYKNTPSKDATRFAIGELETSGGKFRIYFIIKNVDNSVYLQEMRFEQQRSR